MCGVVGLKLFRQGSAAEIALNMLLRLQHRGQDGAGLSILNAKKEFESVKGLGLIQNALKDWTTLSPGTLALAHTRYATTGYGGVSELQPFIKGLPRMALAHNGNIVNTAVLEKKYPVPENSSSDLDVLQSLYLMQTKNALESGLSPKEAFLKAMETMGDEVEGGYALFGIEEDGTLFAFRDPFGIRPLFMARSKDFVVVASETSALSPLSALCQDLKIEELAPGEWIRVSDTFERGQLTSKLNPKNQKRFCMFEILYFSSPQSEIGDDSIYGLRFRLGESLALEIMKKEGRQNLRSQIDYVVPVPETSRTAALAVAETLQVPYREYLVKNPYIPRTFILSQQEQRLKALNAKLSLIGPEIRGKKILLVDDSVVRGNTSRMMADRLREAGAASVRLASTCPPIVHGCYYGIDFPDPEELIAHKKKISEIAQSLKMDELYYLSIEGLKEALRSQDFCMACLDGQYPVGSPEVLQSFADERKRQRL